MSEETKHVRQIEVIAEATTIQKWKKQLVAGQRGQKQFTFLSDEGSYMPGGESSAPTPLTYFVSGVAL
jgi:histidinol dehydrogenase